MSRKLEGKIALITGAAAGIGRAATELFLAEGAKVIATDRDLKGLDGLAAEKVQLDVTDSAAITALAKATGRVDVLFNCAGFVENGTILDNDDAQWEKSFQINVYAMARMIKAFLPAMLEGGGGSIINVASVAGSIKGIPNRCIYGASKAAVDRPDQVGGGRLCHQGHSLQLGLPRHGGFPLAAAAAEGHRRL